MIEDDILEALQIAANDAIAASEIPSMQVKPVAMTGPDPSDGRYVEYVQIVNNRTDDYWGSERVYQGAFRLILHWPIDGQGAAPPMRYLKQLANGFPKGRVLRSGAAAVLLYDVPDFNGAIENSSEVLYPLTVRYRDFSASA